MNVVARLEDLYDEYTSNVWLRYFTVFCRVALALGFIPSGIVKITGERFTGLPPNHPLGHYFDALHLTGSYYTFIGVGQLTAAVLLLIPRTALLGAVVYFPIILNICVLTYATRFEGTRITTLMLLANVFLLSWDYRRLKTALFPSSSEVGAASRPATTSRRFPWAFFAFVFAVAAAVIVVNAFLFDVRPGNSPLECSNACASNARPADCRRFCDCIYVDGGALDRCLTQYEKPKE